MQRAKVRNVAGALLLSMGLLKRRMREAADHGGLPSPALRALARLDRGGPATTADLARIEQMTPQAMGTIVAVLEGRGYVSRVPDPQDGRRMILMPTDDGLHTLRSGRSARTEHITDVLLAGFSDDELQILRAAAPLLERLAEQI